MGETERGGEDRGGGGQGRGGEGEVRVEGEGGGGGRYYKYVNIWSNDRGGTSN